MAEGSTYRSFRWCRCWWSESQNVDLSNTNIGENPMLRVPSQGSSTKGESGPKIRLKGIVDGQQVNILVPPPSWFRGMEEARLAKRWLSVQGRKVIKKVMESLFLRMEPQFWMSPRITNSAIFVAWYLVWWKSSHLPLHHSTCHQHLSQIKLHIKLCCYTDMYSWAILFLSGTTNMIFISNSTNFLGGYAMDMSTRINLTSIGWICDAIMWCNRWTSALCTHSVIT